MALFKPAWQSNNEEKALQAVVEIDDPTDLALIAATDKVCLPAALEAVRKLDDQDILTDIARQNERKELRKAAALKITDKAVLVDIAAHEKDYGILEAVIDRITDQNVLTDIAKSPDHNARNLAVKKLNDPDVIADIACNHASVYTRYTAFKRLTDSDAIANAAKSFINTLEYDEKDDYFRKEIVDKLDSRRFTQRKYTDIAKNCIQVHVCNNPFINPQKADTGYEEATDVCMAAVGKLTEDKLLANLAKTAADGFVRYEAMRRLLDDAALSELTTITDSEFCNCRWMQRNWYKSQEDDSDIYFEDDYVTIDLRELAQTRLDQIYRDYAPFSDIPEEETY